MKTVRIFFAISGLLMAEPALAQGHGNHGHGGGQSAGMMPVSPGQEAFGAIAEIIALLSANPSTDWQKVDIPALQAHLQDMDALVMIRGVAGEAVPGGLKMIIPLTGQGGAAASRMLPAHGPVLQTETGWEVVLQQQPDHLIWTVISANPAEVTKIRALGFIGLMATGWHHQAHHLAIARGEPAH